MENIKQNLSSLKLTGMASCWQTLTETRRADSLSLQDGLELLLQAEKDQRNSNRTQRLLRDARFRYEVCPEQVMVDPSRGLSPLLFDRLLQGNYLKSGECILVTGATGCGKSHLISAFGSHACHQGFSVRYFSILSYYKAFVWPVWRGPLLSSMKKWPRSICSFLMILG